MNFSFFFWVTNLFSLSFSLSQRKPDNDIVDYNNQAEDEDHNE